MPGVNPEYEHPEDPAGEQESLMLSDEAKRADMRRRTRERLADVLSVDRNDDDEYGTAMERWEAYWCGANVTLPTQQELDDEEDAALELQWVNQRSWHVDGYADND
jgi:hypothetical protein